MEEGKRNAERPFLEPYSERMEEHIEKLLERVHESSGSPITANSRRLRTLRNNPSAYAKCHRDVQVHNSVPNYTQFVPYQYPP